VNDWVFNQENYYDEYNNEMLHPRRWESDEDYDYIFKVELKQNAPTMVKAFQFGQAHRGGVATMR
jgi:hypothetical protein